LVEIWNSIPGLTPVRKFTDRKSALARIWKAIQSLNGSAAQPVAKATPKPVRKPKSMPKKSKSAKADGKGKPAKAARDIAREGSKKAEVLGLSPR
jgi:hypothetical protein